MMLSSVQSVTISPVKLSTFQNAVISSSTSATMYTTPSQNSGALSSSPSRARGCVLSHADARRVGVTRGTGTASSAATGGSSRSSSSSV